MPFNIFWSVWMVWLVTTPPLFGSQLHSRLEAPPPFPSAGPGGVSFPPLWLPGWLGFPDADALSWLPATPLPEADRSLHFPSHAEDSCLLFCLPRQLFLPSFLPSEQSWLSSCWKDEGSAVPAGWDQQPLSQVSQVEVTLHYFSFFPFLKKKIIFF